MGKIGPFWVKCGLNADQLNSSPKIKESTRFCNFSESLVHALGVVGEAMENVYSNGTFLQGWPPSSLGKNRVDVTSSNLRLIVVRFSLTALGLQDFRLGKCTAWT